MISFISSGWFIVLLFAMLIVFALANKLLWWALGFVLLGLALGAAECITLVRTGRTLSTLFGEWYADNKARGRWMLALLLLAVLGICAHLAVS